MKINGFIVAIFAAIIIAYFLPQGIEVLPLSTIIDVGIGLIFFLYGLKLAPSEIKAGLKNYKSHLVIQLTTFVIFPLLALACLPLFKEGTTSQLWIALFFFATLPSTVSSSVVMVSIAKGNIPTAIFNASLSGLIGIFATPLWLEIFLQKSTSFEFTTVLLKLFLQIILPLVLGLFFQKFIGDFVKEHGKKFGLVDKATIILIVYSSFSNSFTSDLFQTVSVGALLKLFGLIVAFFFIIYFGLNVLCNALHFDIKDKIATQFCGTKKSLVHGSVMVKVIFGNSAATGLLLLPIMLFHSLQLLIIAYFAERYGKRKIME
ncbi:bile acid:sodium symporter family protein [Zunongwangia sp. H14]|uniref:bile acid:sodium symporter family protein n=1 Tax=Zunongwangia sp. H14 TaxID=3240792 RepID=UPI003567BE95